MGRQHRDDGRFLDGDLARFFAVAQPAMLEILAGYETPVAQVGILRLLPWIVAAQNPDGSWGEPAVSDRATLAVVGALGRVRDRLPAGFGI